MMMSSRLSSTAESSGAFHNVRGLPAAESFDSRTGIEGRANIESLISIEESFWAHFFASQKNRAIRSNKNPAGFYSAPIPCAA
jgi:hypothetical protein